MIFLCLTLLLTYLKLQLYKADMKQLNSHSDSFQIVLKYCDCFMTCIYLNISLCHVIKKEYHTDFQDNLTKMAKHTHTLYNVYFILHTCVSSLITYILYNIFLLCL